MFQNIRELYRWEDDRVIKVSPDRIRMTKNLRPEQGQKVEKEKWNILRTKMFVAALLFHGAAATRSGAPRAMIEAKRIVVIEGNDRKKGSVAGDFGFKGEEGLLKKSVADRNWAQERSSGATRHPEERKGTTMRALASLSRVRKRSAITHREVKRGKGKRLRMDTRCDRPSLLCLGMTCRD